MITLKGAAVSLSPVSESAVRDFRDWLDQGMQAGMAYMENWFDIRRNPETLLEGAKSMIIIAVPFPLGEVGPIASYALGEDYHDVIRALFKPCLERLTRKRGGEWRICVDSAPVMERYWSVRSGLCRNTLSGMVATDGFGTAFFLAELITTLTLPDLGLEENAILATLDFVRLLELDVDVPEYTRSGLKPSECVYCGRCINSCPGLALCKGKVDSRTCLSYLTIEHRGDFDSPDARKVMETEAGRSTVFGCDRCLVNCPLNHPPFRDQSRIHFHKALMPRPGLSTLSRDSIAQLSPQDFSVLFRRSPVKRAKLAGLRRNVGLPPLE